MDASESRSCDKEEMKGRSTQTHSSLVFLPYQDGTSSLPKLHVTKLVGLRPTMGQDRSLWYRFCSAEN